MLIWLADEYSSGPWTLLRTTVGSGDAVSLDERYTETFFATALPKLVDVTLNFC